MPDRNIFTLDLEAHLALLSNEQWKKTDYYELCCDSELWGCAFYISIDKAFASTETEALTYLLERFVIEGELLKKVENTKEDYIGIRNLMLTGLSNPTGVDMTDEQFYRSFEEIYTGMLETQHRDQKSTLCKNGVQIPMSKLLEKRDVCLVTCFADKWNYRQYLVETGTRWVYFEWATGV